MNERNRPVDGLRALALLAVLLDNFDWKLPCGWVGVQMFFVLSGWLITRILLDEKIAARSAGVYFGRFYARRSLRIFPLYYAYLFVLQVAYSIARVPEGWPTTRPFALGYVVNFGIAKGIVDTTPFFGHLWTLSLEEQFYLAWPLLVWWLGPRALSLLALSFIIAGPALRGLGVHFGMNPGTVYVSTWAHFDALGTGALLALYRFDGIKRALRAALPIWIVTFTLGMVVLAVSPRLTWRSFGYPEGLPGCYGYIWGYTVLNVSAAFLILAASRGEIPFLGNPWLTYLGRISYGLYMFHRPVIGIYGVVVRPLLPPSLPGWTCTVIGLTIVFCTTSVLAMLSFRFFESPLLAWRDRKVPALRHRPVPLGQP